MFLIKLLGSIDIISAIIIWLSAVFDFIPSPLILLVAFYLLVKGVVFLFSADIASILDIACSIVIFLSLSFHMPVFIMIVVALFLLQKGIFSWLSC